MNPHKTSLLHLTIRLYMTSLQLSYFQTLSKKKAILIQTFRVVPQPQIWNLREYSNNTRIGGPLESSAGERVVNDPISREPRAQ